MKSRCAAIQKLEQRVKKIGSVLCIGLDSDLKKLPKIFLAEKKPQLTFNKWIIDQTYPYAAAYKLNTAFYEARGVVGWREMAETIEYMQKMHPDIFIIADAKRADIGSTNESYCAAFFDQLQVDALTLNPYLGQEALQPFLDRKDKACIILCKTSNPGSGEFQDLKIEGEQLWERVAKNVVNNWNGNQNCMLVVGATYPRTLKKVRTLVGEEMWLLVPGVGAQGGDFKQVLQMGQNRSNLGVLVTVSRDIIFCQNPIKASNFYLNQL
ncbi:MAG: orotidine-5'-phosphate decarboxylase [Candidatus Pacebacteria bacterium CG_4_10_14_0_8_um_filter_43_12]|nr:MAG: orotidine-5'-phosphate decarboxylase [Candidatus Pacebacteria bacterium CG10_big_fil_rev_8_21_14_0_10_44_11]PIY79101.1 MAG: orotidine-5'-phosphate decarboxylase [Candidatus Pacebacteria bacterium CG_4_10_14_0_8_um_filter_43_12]